ncbi:hypothetical protein BpHYR1_049415 [Brachionus plicatilis]|uniref:Uncharacterized protein n=1 Tax=Brachionus plicatilis TaxID=10195 RepID=A0A3M7PBE3_BRAPC|nr:hypothetical protein BpHYR1_049415 [Brachionus plicatilis]
MVLMGPILDTYRREYDIYRSYIFLIFFGQFFMLKNQKLYTRQDNVRLSSDACNSTLLSLSKQMWKKFKNLVSELENLFSISKLLQTILANTLIKQIEKNKQLSKNCSIIERAMTINIHLFLWKIEVHDHRKL